MTFQSSHGECVCGGEVVFQDAIGVTGTPMKLFMCHGCGNLALVSFMAEPILKIESIILAAVVRGLAPGSHGQITPAMLGGYPWGVTIHGCGLTFNGILRDDGAVDRANLDARETVVKAVLDKSPGLCKIKVVTWKDAVKMVASRSVMRWVIIPTFNLVDYCRELKDILFK